jgi:hypothetical protein
MVYQMSNKDIEPGSALLQGEDGNLKVIAPNSGTIDSFVVIPLKAFPFTGDYTEGPSGQPGITQIDQSVGLRIGTGLEVTITVVDADFQKHRIKDEVFPEDATHLALAENPVRIVAMKFCGDWHRAL